MRRRLTGSLVALTMIGVSPCLAQAPVQEPELFNVVHAIEASGKPLPLERQTGQSSAKRGPLGFGGSATFEITGPTSPITLKSGVRHDFVIRLAGGVDLGKYKLYAYQIKENSREVVLVKVSGISGKSQQTAEIPFDISKYGESSYKFAIAETVPAGQYCFGTTDANRVFCFGLLGPAPADAR